MVVAAVPGGLVVTGGFVADGNAAHKLSTVVVNLDVHRCAGLQAEGDKGARVERIGIDRLKFCDERDAGGASTLRGIVDGDRAVEINSAVQSGTAAPWTC